MGHAQRTSIGALPLLLANQAIVKNTLLSPVGANQPSMFDLSPHMGRRPGQLERGHARELLDQHVTVASAA